MLPDKPSELLVLALEDLEKVEKDPKYQVNMGTWHRPSEFEPVCLVCLAGAVMAGHLQAKPEKQYVASDFGGRNMSKFYALANFATDHIRKAVEEAIGPEAFEELGERYYRIPVHAPNFKSYSEDPESFKSSLRATAAFLKELGL